MSSQFETGFETTLNETLTSASVNTTIKLAALPTVTSGVMMINTGTSQEWVAFTGLDSGDVNITGCSRGLKKTATNLTDVDTALKKNHAVGVPVILVAHSVDLNDKANLSSSNTFAGNNTFNSTNTFTGDNIYSSGKSTFTSTTESQLGKQNLTTIQRDALTGVVEGDQIYNTDDEEINTYRNSAWVKGVGLIAITEGGTGQTTQTEGFDALSPTTTKGDIIVRNTSDNIRLAVGTDGQVLSSDSTETSGLKWIDSGGAETKIFLSPQEIYVTTASETINDSAPIINFLNSTTNEVYIGFQVPEGKTGISAFKIIYKNDQSSSDLYFAVSSTLSRQGNNNVLDSDARAYTTQVATAQMASTTLNAASYDGLEPFADFDLLGFKISRQAGNVLDTYEGTLRCYGVEITFS